MDVNPAWSSGATTPARASRSSIYDEGGNALVMLLTIPGSLVAGWLLLEFIAWLNPPGFGWVGFNAPLAHGAALLLGIALTQAIRRIRVARRAEGKARRLIMQYRQSSRTTPSPR